VTTSSTTTSTTTTTTTTIASSPAVGLAPTVTAAPPPPSSGSARTAPASSSPGTFRGAGGAVTVRLVSDVLQLVSAQPAPGYEVTEQRVMSDEIEIRFEGPAGRTNIVVKVDHGRIVPVVEEDPSSRGPGERTVRASNPAAVRGRATTRAAPVGTMAGPATHPTRVEAGSETAQAIPRATAQAATMAATEAALQPDRLGPARSGRTTISTRRSRSIAAR
jgi:hypothetical protein